MALTQPFINHVHELRRRIFWSVLFLIAGATVGYFYRDSLVELLQKPLHLPLYSTSPSGSFQFIMQISLSVGLLCSIPVFIFNMVRFVEPAFKRITLKMSQVIQVMLASILLAAAGVLFAYKVILPMSFHFFAGFNIGPIQPLISTSSYFSYILYCLITFAVLFQLPLLLLFINHIHRFPPGTLRRHRRHVIVGSLGIAIILPFTYDPLTQFLIALPVVLLYEASLILVWLINRKSQKKLTGSIYAHC